MIALELNKKKKFSFHFYNEFNSKEEKTISMGK